MADAPALMEASLAAVAKGGFDIRHAVYARFFEAFPARTPVFLNPDVSSVRMTDETVQMLYGLATDEKWVWPLVAELTFTHRNYGPLPAREWDVFVNLVVEELGKAAGEVWTPACADAWQKQAERLKAMIAKANAEWAVAMPGAKTT